MQVWNRVNTEVLQNMRMLDLWLMFIVALLILLITLSRVPAYQDFKVWAAILGAVATIWVGRLDVLIHRPVPASIAIEEEINSSLLTDSGKLSQKTRGDEGLGIPFKSWENYYKRRLKRGVLILVPLDALAGIFLFALFLHANNAAYQYLKDVWYQSYFWWACMFLHFVGWGIIAAAKPLAE